MRHRLATTALAVLTLALAGCFEIHALLRLDADGSGTIEETVLFQGFLASMMTEADSTGTGYIDVARFEARADSLGEGVRFVRVDSLEEGEAVGYRAVYAFDDINTVRYRADDDALGTNMEDDASAEEPPGLEVPMRFAYAPGALTVYMDRKQPAEDARPIHPDSLAALADSIRSQMAEGGAVARAIFEGARMSITLEVPGAITETNATFADERTVTFADVDLGAFIGLMIDDPELAARIQLAETEEDRRAAFEALNAQTGFRAEQQDEVTVRFGG